MRSCLFVWATLSNVLRPTPRCAYLQSPLARGTAKVVSHKRVGSILDKGIHAL